MRVVLLFVVWKSDSNFLASTVGGIQTWLAPHAGIETKYLAAGLESRAAQAEVKYTHTDAYIYIYKILLICVYIHNMYSIYMYLCVYIYIICRYVSGSHLEAASRPINITGRSLVRTFCACTYQPKATLNPVAMRSCTQHRPSLFELTCNLSLSILATGMLPRPLKCLSRVFMPGLTNRNTTSNLQSLRTDGHNAAPLSAKTSA